MYITRVFDIVGINVLNKHAKINDKSDINSWFDFSNQKTLLGMAVVVGVFFL